MEKEGDPILNRFKGFMDIVFYNCRIDYYKELSTNKTIDIDKIENLIYIQSFNENELIDIRILSYKERFLLDQLYIQGLTYKEISSITNEKVSTLKKRRNRAINKLKERLKYYGEF